MDNIYEFLLKFDDDLLAIPCIITSLIPGSHVLCSGHGLLEMFHCLATAPWIIFRLIMLLSSNCISSVFSSPFLCYLYLHFIISQDDDKLYIFLELVTKGSLASLYQKYRLRDSQVSAYTRQILSGLKYLHDHNVVHR